MHDRTRRVLRRGGPVAVALLVVGGGGAVTWAATTGNGAGNYRTVAATTGNVEQLLTLTGIVAPVSEASATFAVSGTVTRVDVAVGDSVAAGQELATIDTKPLQDAVTQAEATLATVQETYAVSSDTSSASASATGSSTTASGGGKSTTGSSATVSTGAVPVSQKSATTSRTGSSGTGSADGGSTGGKTKDMDFSAETKAVDKASAEVTTLSKAATRALSSASTACAASQPTDSTTPTPTATPTPTSTPVPTTSSPPTTASTGSDPRTSCLAALTTVQEAQSAVATAQSALSAAQSTFGSILTGGAASLQKSGSSAAGATSTTPVTGVSIGAPTASAPAASVATTATTAAAATPTTAAKSAATPSGGGGTAGASSAGDTASRVADANVSVLEAQNALQVARDALASATLTAPISGTVATIPFIVGGTAGTSNALTIVGTGAVRVTVDVPLASLPKVKVGQNTRVTASGATKPVGGKIESVAILPVSGTTTFPVTVLVAEPAAALASGSSATASIVLSTLTDVVTVPNSALTRTGTGTAAVVTVSSGGAVSRKQVALGAVGALSSQVQSGLKAGDQVVLADLSQAVPANSTTSTVRGAGGGGIPPGGAGAGGRPTG